MEPILDDDRGDLEESKSRRLRSHVSCHFKSFGIKCAAIMLEQGVIAFQLLKLTEVVEDNF